MTKQDIRVYTRQNGRTQTRDVKYIGNFSGFMLETSVLKSQKNCRARLIVIPTAQQQYPAIQDVPLTWEGQDVNVDTNIEKDIQPNSRELLHIIFSDSTFPTVNVDPPTPIHAVISREEFLDNTSSQFIESGFIVGDFKIKVTITSDNAKECKSYFSVYVGNEWDQLSMKKIPWFKSFWMHSR